MSILIGLFAFLFFFVLGHLLSALFLYSAHRFVFHGKLRRWPVLKRLARLHGLHHAHIDKELDKFIFVPWWVSILLILTVVLFGCIHPGLGLGIASFAALYAHRHWAIHHHDFSSKFHLHHDYHHREDVLKNLSGVYPFIDKIFGTYAPSNLEHGEK